MINDAFERQRALDTSKSFIVQAPAGSGKTGLLVYRLLALLARVESPEEILAITFTRKATHEMRERVLNLLRRAAEGETSEDAFVEQGLELGRRVLENSERRDWNLLSDPAQLQIFTIDAFCAQLAASLPWLSRLGDKPRVCEDASHLYQAAVDQLLRQLLNREESSLSTSLNRVMLELDYNYPRARDLFVSMLSKRDQWLRYLGAQDLESLRQQLEASWHFLAQESIDRLELEFDPIFKKQLFECTKLSYQAQELDWPLSDENSLASQLAQWRILAEVLCTKGREPAWRKKVTKREGFFAGQEHTLKMNELLLELQDQPDSVLDAIVEVSHCPTPTFDPADWETIQATQEVLLFIAAQLQLQFRRVGECDFTELNQRACMALRSLHAGSNKSISVQASLGHILVDEFQDTSVSQTDLLYYLTHSWSQQAETRSRTLFLVGDPMQSIYRFREAEVGNFLQVQDNSTSSVFPNIEIESIGLTENFRSNANLVDWFNWVFADVLPRYADPLVGAIPYSPATTSKPVTQDSVEYLLSESKQLEAERVVQRVKAILPSLSDGQQIAILVRSRKRLVPIIEALKTAELEFAGVDTEPLAALPEINDLITLCRALTRPTDRLAWLSLVRSPLCGLTLAELHTINSDPSRTLWQSLKSPLVDQLDEASQVRIHRLVDIMELALAELHRCSLAALLRSTWLKLGGLDACLFATETDIENVLAIVAELEVGGDLMSFNELQSRVDRLFAQSPVPRANIVVSTMHKAKGLQYHTIILPGLEGKAHNDEKEVLMWAETSHGQHDRRLYMAAMHADETKYSHYNYLRRLESQRARYETSRLFYVAATRAQERLILSASLPLNKKGDEQGLPQNPVKGSLLSQVWQQLKDKFADNTLLSESEGSDKLEFGKLWRLPHDYQYQSPSQLSYPVVAQLTTSLELQESINTQAELEFEWATELATCVGIVLHDHLALHGANIIHQKIDEAQRSIWLRLLRRQRLPESLMAPALSRLQVAVERIQSDQSSHFLFTEQTGAQNELTLSSLEEGKVRQYRVDRTFIDEQGRRWIVDFKSTDTQQTDKRQFAMHQVRERHQAQMQKYGDLFAAIEPESADEKGIELAVYFPLLQQLVHWRYGENPTE